MSYTEGYGDNYSNGKIPYDDIPISRRLPKKKSQRVSVSSFKVLVSIVAVMFIVNIGLCLALIYHMKHAVVKDVVVHNNSITLVGNEDIPVVSSDTAKWSSVCVAAGGSCDDENSFYKNTSSRGSGVIYKVDEDKNEVYIITCNHVIDGHDKYYVMLPSRLIPIEVERVGYSQHYDLAVLKFTDTSKLEGCTPIQVYDSTNLMTGEKVLAVGNSLSGGLSITSGIISRINTMIKVEGNTFLSREIQIDAAINPGNSGGGAFNSEGKFIGLVNAKLNTTQSGNSTITVTGTAYAIPSKLVTSIADSMIYNNGAPTCVNLAADLAHDKDYGITKHEIAEGRYIETYKVRVKSVSPGSISSGKLMRDDHIKSFRFTDIYGKEYEVNMFNMYTFEDIKFIIKPYSTITFVVDRAFVGEKTISITASSFSTY